jgi:hypothetical protein
VSAGWAHLKAYGYAPGSYSCVCFTCKKVSDLDKRATRCRPCAEKLHAEPPTTRMQSPTETARRLELDRAVRLIESLGGVVTMPETMGCEGSAERKG